MKLETFNNKQISTVRGSADTAEELVTEEYKISAAQWLKNRYDIKTAAYLEPHEIIANGPFAQVVRYTGKKPKTSSLSSATYDFYKICMQDHSIISILRDIPSIELFPFCIYAITHELIHIVRFSKFLQRFDVSKDERAKEEYLVHKKTQEILKNGRCLPNMEPVLKFYDKWNS